MSYKQIPNLPPIIAASSDMLFEAVQGGSSGKVSLDVLFQFINDRIESYTAINPQARVATTANIALTGLQTIDGVTVAAGDRVLVKN